MEIKLGNWIINADVERTRETYATIKKGGCVKCGCSYCRNYIASLSNVLPAEVMEFFVESGIDPKKDAEVYEMGEVSSGVRSYGGEYYLWGEIVSKPKEETIINNNFTFCFTKPSPLAQEVFRNEGALCFLFNAEVPWVLPDESNA